MDLINSPNKNIQVINHFNKIMVKAKINNNKIKAKINNHEINDMYRINQIINNLIYSITNKINNIVQIKVKEVSFQAILETVETICKKLDKILLIK